MTASDRRPRPSVPRPPAPTGLTPPARSGLARPARLLAVSTAGLACAVAVAAGAAAPDAAAPKLWGVELEVADVARSATFYREALAFEPLAEAPAGGWAVLHQGDLRLALVRAGGRPEGAAEGPRVYLNVSVGALAPVGRAVRRAGGTLDAEEPGESAVGLYLQARDPDGHVVHLIDHPWDELGAADPPVVFNVGVHVRDIAEAEAFYATLGFPVSTRDYLPETLVFARQGAGYFVLHPHAREGRPAGVLGSALLVDGDPAAAAARLGAAQAGRVVLPAGLAPPFAVELRDPAENRVVVARRGAVEAAGVPVAAVSGGGG